MYPILFGSFPAYYGMWLVGDAVCILLAAHAARSEGARAWRGIAAALLALVILGAGSKLLYLAESVAFPDDDYVPHEFRGPIHGFRIPGGVIAVMLSLPVLLRVACWHSALATNRLLTIVAAFILFVRLGCFLNGCCFGAVSQLPWATTFPAGSWAHSYHVQSGSIGDAATTSLAVHPLQAYFALVALATAAILVGLRRSRELSSHSEAIFFALFVASSFLLENLRGNTLHLNLLLLGALTAATAVGISPRALRIWARDQP